MQAVRDGVLRLLGHAAKAPLRTKRREGSPTDLWVPYYAGYNSSFAEQVLRETCSTGKARVLDPWNGSGTTTSTAARLGFTAVGLDLNPFSLLAARAKLVGAAAATELAEVALQISSNARLSGPSVVNPSDPLREWMTPESVAAVRTAQLLIDRYACVAPYELKERRAYLHLCLILAARSVVRPYKLTNPTWVRPRVSDAANPGTILAAFHSTAASFAKDLRAETPNESARRHRVRLLRADSRKMPLSDCSIDVILGSPPYCTRLDYATSTSFELSALGIGRNSEEFENLRASTMGTSLIRGEKKFPARRSWGPLAAKVMKGIREHPSKASSGYYYKHYWQYFDDARASITEAARVLRPGGLAVLVLQNSYYKEIEIPLPQIYCEMANRSGMDSVVVSTLPVSRVLAWLRAGKGTRRYREEVVALFKR